MERERLLARTLKLSREREDNHQLAQVLRELSDVHLQMDLYEEGIEEAKEALEIFEGLSDTVGRAQCSIDLAQLFYYDDQLDAAEEAASHAISPLSEMDQQFDICQCHRLLGVIYHSMGETEKAINHLEAGLETASSHNWLNQLSWTRFSLAELFSDQGRLDDASANNIGLKRQNPRYRVLLEAWGRG